MDRDPQGLEVVRNECNNVIHAKLTIRGLGVRMYLACADQFYLDDSVFMGIKLSEK